MLTMCNASTVCVESWRSTIEIKGYAPGWQIRCPKCGLTVPASQTGIVRVGGFGKNFKPGYCERCRRNRFLILERMPENPTASAS
jgi:hypothetical protein